MSGFRTTPWGMEAFIYQSRPIQIEKNDVTIQIGKDTSKTEAKATRSVLGLLYHPLGKALESRNQRAAGRISSLSDCPGCQSRVWLIF